jgi:hypothetical protein
MCFYVLEVTMTCIIVWKWDSLSFIWIISCVSSCKRISIVGHQLHIKNKIHLASCLILKGDADENTDISVISYRAISN